jgi:hypothetical protein
MYCFSIKHTSNVLGGCGLVIIQFMISFLKTLLRYIGVGISLTNKMIGNNKIYCVPHCLINNTNLHIDINFCAHDEILNNIE